jgi:hypothetical protein
MEWATVLAVIAHRLLPRSLSQTKCLESQCPDLEDWPYVLIIFLEINVIKLKSDIAC